MLSRIPKIRPYRPSGYGIFMKPNNMATLNLPKESIIALTFAVFCALATTAHSTPEEAQKAGPRRSERENLQISGNPFKRFIGEWALKEDRWSQNWGQGTEHIKIPNHHTLSQTLNTDNSLLSTVDATSPRGHILWSYNRTTRQVHHLSSFGTARNGVGTGTVNQNGDVTLKVSFGGEQADTHRIYTYKWISEDEYELMSIQYDSKNKPTGHFYGGTFIRIRQKQPNEKDLAAIQKLLRVIDDNDAEMETKLSVYEDSIIHMAPDHGVITSKTELGKLLEEQKKHGYADMTHEIAEVFPFERIVLMRGQVIGTYHPKDGSKPFPFRTKNLFVFRRQDDGSLKVWQVIFNRSPNT